MPKTHPAQFEALVSFMERHGDLNKPGLFPLADTLQKWDELVSLLNRKPCGVRKSVVKWKKVWSDLKNNTQRKIKKIARGELKNSLSTIEKRVLKIMQRNNGEQKNVDESAVQGIVVEVKEEIESNSCQRTPSPEFFAEVDAEDASQRLLLESSLASSSSFHIDSHQGINNSQNPNNLERPAEEYTNDMTERYIEFEREREKMAHKREMTRIKQNEQIYNLFGRLVNVLETLAPSIQAYLDRTVDDKESTE